MFVDGKSLVLKLDGSPATRNQVYQNAIEAATRMCRPTVVALSHNDLKKLIQNGELPPSDKLLEGGGKILYVFSLELHLRLRRGSACYYCGATSWGPDPLERDHVIPKARGGPDSEMNIVTACRSCNQQKAAQNVHDFRKHTRKKYGAERAPSFFGELPEVRKALRINTQTR